MWFSVSRFCTGRMDRGKAVGKFEKKGAKNMWTRDIVLVRVPCCLLLLPSSPHEAVVFEQLPAGIRRRRCPAAARAAPLLRTAGRRDGIWPGIEDTTAGSPMAALAAAAAEAGKGGGKPRADGVC